MKAGLFRSFILGIFFVATPTHAANDGKSDFGQTIIVGFVGTEKTAPGFIDVMQNLESGRIGGVIFLPRNMANPTKLRDMTLAIKNCKCKFPPFIALDEEGGRIQRLGPKLKEKNLPSARETALLSDEQRHAIFETMATRVHNYGFNLNFGPVVDLDINPKNKIIGELGRSYSKDHEEVTALAKEFIEAHRGRGILTALKHFPGHGSAQDDTHKVAVDVTAVWKEIEIKPYADLIQEDLADMVMVGHLASRKWGGTATLKGSTAISDLLRRRLKYNGVVITDDMFMGAVRDDKRTAVDATISSFYAGADLVILSRLENQDEDVGRKMYNALSNALEQNDALQKHVRRSVERVLQLKHKIEPTKAENSQNIIESTKSFLRKLSE